jgi:hypothetical protein
MPRPTRLEILEYALEGARTERGIWSGAMTEEQEELLDDHIEWLAGEIERVNAKEQQHV